MRAAQLKLQKSKLSFERSLGGPDLPVFGVDEVGRGCIAGPVVTAAVCILPGAFLEVQSSPISAATVRLSVRANWMSLVDDSKTISESTRELIFAEAAQSPFVFYALGEASVEEIDKMNILHASLLAMDRATDALLEKVESRFDKRLFQDRNFILVDGNRLPKKHGHRSLAVVMGDSKSLSIGLASIMAKVTRDRLMTGLSKDFSNYGWDENKGYPTPKHKAQLEVHGVTPWHRTTFSPVSEILDRNLPVKMDPNGKNQSSKANPNKDESKTAT